MSYFPNYFKYFCALIISAGSSVISTAQNQDDIPLPACDITDIQYVYSQAMQQNVTLTTRLTGDANSLPRAALSLSLADGTEINLGGGGKYIDDFAADSIPSCEDHLRVATSATIGSLTATQDKNIYNYITTYGELMGLIAMRQDCQFPAGGPNKDYDELSEPCQRAANVLAAYTESESQLKSWPIGRHDYLLKRDAPIIYVTGSTYFVTINVYDPIDNIMREIMYEGC